VSLPEKAPITGVCATAAILALLALSSIAGAAERLACRVHDVPEAGRLATCTGQIGPRYPQWTWVLIGEPPDRITRIEIFEPGKEQPRQVLEGIDERPPLARDFGENRGRVGFVLEDVNFDGMPDLRLAKGPPDESGTAYRWWLFDKSADSFAPSEALDSLRNPAVNRKRRLVIGAARDERGRQARIFYRWQQGQLAPVSAEAQGNDEHGTCVRSHYTVKDGKFEKLRETDCRRISDSE
jgi:hypothetical protein